MNEAEFNRLLETAQRRPLTTEEELRLREYGLVQPEAQARWEEEEALTQLIRRLPAAPLSSNFTARVLDAVAREPGESVLVAPAAWWGWLGRWNPLKAGTVGTTAAAVVLLAFHQYQQTSRAELARTLAAFSQAATLAEVEVWRDFEAIRRLSQLPEGVDVELISEASP
jgi:hypothetical protein